MTPYFHKFLTTFLLEYLFFSKTSLFMREQNNLNRIWAFLCL